MQVIFALFKLDFYYSVHYFFDQIHSVLQGTQFYSFHSRDWFHAYCVKCSSTGI